MTNHVRFMTNPCLTNPFSLKIKNVLEIKKNTLNKTTEKKHNINIIRPQ